MADIMINYTETRCAWGEAVCNTVYRGSKKTKAAPRAAFMSHPYQESIAGVHMDPAVSNQALPVLGTKRNATPLLHQRCPVGGGPSSNTWP
jgi:hypothetical protein